MNEAVKIIKSDIIIILIHFVHISLIIIDDQKQLKLTVLNEHELSE